MPSNKAINLKATDQFNEEGGGGEGRCCPEKFKPGVAGFNPSWFWEVREGFDEENGVADGIWCIWDSPNGGGNKLCGVELFAAIGYMDAWGKLNWDVVGAGWKNVGPEELFITYIEPEPGEGAAPKWW